MNKTRRYRKHKNSPKRNFGDNKIGKKPNESRRNGRGGDISEDLQINDSVVLNGLLNGKTEKDESLDVRTEIVICDDVNQEADSESILVECDPLELDNEDLYCESSFIKIEEPDNVDCIYEDEYNDYEEYSDGIAYEEDNNRKIEIGDDYITLVDEETNKHFIESREYNKSIEINDGINLRYYMKKGRKKQNDDEIRCDICFKSFSRNTNLKRHLIIHSKEKPFKCEHCNKSFSQKAHLKYHQYKHTGVKPYKCNICYKSFTLLHTLTQHQLIHTGDKPYTCEFCHKTFRYANVLKHHKNIHMRDKPFNCNVCEKNFGSLSSLQQHQVIHTRRYKCEYCTKTFNKLFNLKRHHMIHFRKNKS